MWIRDLSWPANSVALDSLRYDGGLLLPGYIAVANSHTWSALGQVKFGVLYHKELWDQSGTAFLQKCTALLNLGLFVLRSVF